MKTTKKDEPLYKSLCKASVGSALLLTPAYMLGYPEATVTIWPDKILIQQNFFGYKMTSEIHRATIKKITRYRNPLFFTIMPGIRIWHKQKGVKPFVAVALYVDFEPDGKAVQILRENGYPVDF